MHQKAGRRGDESSPLRCLGRRIGREEQRELVRRYRAGDPEALDPLIRSVMPWIMKVAGRYARAWRADRALDDLVQEGVCGALWAATKYDPDHIAGASFLGYAKHWIEHYIRVFLGNCLHDIRVPIGLQHELSRARRYVEWHEARGSKKGEYLTEREAMLLGDASLRVKIASLSEPVGHEGDERTWADVIPDGPRKDVVDEVGAHQSATLALGVVQRMLGDRTAAFVAAHFGIGEDHALIYEEIAVRYGVTRQYVHQQIARVLGSPRIRRAIAAALGVSVPQDSQKFYLS